MRKRLINPMPENIRTRSESWLNVIFNELPKGVLGFRLIAVLTGVATLLHLRKHPVNGAAARCSLIDFELVS
jgi:hypothetical protein